MTKHKLNHDNDRDNDHANDNDTDRAIAPAPASGALTSLTALGATLNSVDTTSVGGRSGLPMLQFKAGRQWHLGVRAAAHHPRGRQPVGRQPVDLQVGVDLLGQRQQGARRALVPVSQPMPDVTELPDKGFPWQEQWAST